MSSREASSPPTDSGERLRAAPDANAPATRAQANRREFLHGSSLFLAGSVPAALAQATGAAAKPLRIGLLGCGRWGTKLASTALAVNPAAKISALGDIAPDRLQQAARSLKGKCPQQFDVSAAGRFVGLHAAEQLLASDVDCVLLSTPSKFRLQELQLALEAGQHTYAERSPAVDVASAMEFESTTGRGAERGIVVATGYQLRHSPALREAIEQIRAGMIGEVTHATIASRFVSVEVKQPGLSSFERKLRGWQAYRELSGGVIVDRLGHLVDIVNHVFDDHPTSAASLVAKNNSDFGDVADTVAVEFEYSGGRRLAARAEAVTGTSPLERLQIHGTLGSADLLAGRIVEGSPTGTQRTIWTTSSERHGLASSLLAFFENIQTASTCPHSTLETTLSCLLAEHAGTQGCTMRWSELLGSCPAS